MSKPNRIVANMPKRPFELVAGTRSHDMATSFAEVERLAGYDVKITTVRCGPRRNSWLQYNVWRRAKI